MRTVTVPGGPIIAIHDLGGSGPELLLSHASGFHGRAWTPIASRLKHAFHCIAYDVRGHGDSTQHGPMDADWTWQTLAEDALAVVAQLGLEQPLGLGHSSGATTLLLAEETRPGTFAALYCIEPIGVASDDPPAPMPDHPMAAQARRRRDVFPSRQDAMEIYASKPPLADLTPEGLWAYVEQAFADMEDGSVRLKSRPEHESRMYEYGLSHDVFRRLPRVACPVVLARGGESLAVSSDDMDRWAARLPRGRTEVLAGLGHLAPLQDPDLVASAILKGLQGR